jgi:hypothetical protein
MKIRTMSNINKTVLLREVKSMVDKDKIKSRRIKNLLYLQQCIDNAIIEEVQETLRERPSDIVDRIKYILDESILANSIELFNKEYDVRFGADEDIYVDD